MNGNRLSRFFVFGLFALLPALSWAGDAATLHVVGSSNDGRYFAYEQYGHQDGSGSPYSNIEVIDLKTGQPAQDAHHEGGYEGESRDLASVRRDALANAALSNWNIDFDRKGVPLVQHLLTDIQADSHSVSFSTSPVISGYKADEYSLRLEKYRIEMECSFWNHSFGAKLTLYNWKDGVSRRWGNKIEPMGPGNCVMDFRIQEVRLVSGEADHLLVFLNVYRSGFEGFDVRFLVVSGAMP